MPKLFTKSNALILFAVLILVQFSLLGYQWHTQRSTNNLYKEEIGNLQQGVTSASNGLSYQQVTISPTDKKIYLPQLGIALPLTTLGASLVYSPDAAYVTGSNKLPSGPMDEASISDFATASASQSQTQFNCSSLVRIKFEAKPNPYNPNEVPSGSVPLANGKTLQIYANHLKNCQLEWSVTQANADAIASLFKQAESY